MCLSESTFFSLSRHFGGKIDALGYERFLSLFNQYFENIQRIESMKWLHLFSGRPPDVKYRQIIFIGKDRQGNLRERWQGFSREQLIFVEMYPEYEFTVHGSQYTDKSEPVAGCRSPITGPIHVEDYQLAQLKQYGIEAVKKEVEAKQLSPVILYPEKGFSKRKWPAENFIELYQALREKGVVVQMLESIGLKLEVEEKVFFEDLAEVKNYFQEGGIFVSNDSGMAHLAGQCGLFTITIFTDFDPAVWHPRGRNISLESIKDDIDVRSVEELILSLFLGIKEF